MEAKPPWRCRMFGHKMVGVIVISRSGTGESGLRKECQRCPHVGPWQRKL